MESKEQILNDLNDSGKQVIEVVNNTPAEAFNRQKNGKWSVGDHFAHLVILEGLIIKIMKGRVIPLKDREPNARIKVIRKIFENLDRKLQAGGPINPEPGDKNKEQLEQQFIQNRSQMAEIIEKEDLSLLCLDFKHAFFKELSRLEWVYFAIIHAARHAKQMVS